MLLFNNRYGEYDKNVNNNYNNINEFRGVDLSISYKNKYENYLKQQKLEKERYAKYLLEQQKFQEMKRLQMIRDKKRQDLLDELRLEKERKIIELRNLKEKKKIKDILIRSNYHNQNLIQNQLLKSTEMLKKSSSLPERQAIRKKLLEDNGKHFFFFENEKNFEESIKDHVDHTKNVDNKIFNKKLLEEIEKLKFDNLCQSEDLTKSIKIAKEQAELSNKYKDLMVREVDELKRELKLKYTNTKFLVDFFKSEYLDKILEKKKKMLEDEKKVLELPYLDLEKEGFLIGENNLSKSNVKLYNDNNEINDMSKRVDLWKILQKNQSRLDLLSNYENRGLI